MKKHARVAIIGGGVLGAGLLYFLTKEGWTDIVLIEKGELTSGSTWHAAGLIPHFIGGLSMAKLHQEGPALYKTLEADLMRALERQHELHQAILQRRLLLDGADAVAL